MTTLQRFKEKQKMFDNFYICLTIKSEVIYFWSRIMARLSAFFILIILAALHQVEAGTKPISGTIPSPSLGTSNSSINKMLDITNYLLHSIKSVKIFVEPIIPPKSNLRLPPLIESLIVPSVLQQAPSKHRAAKMLEMGMHIPLNQKFSWGAEVAVSKYKNNLTSETQQKRPLAGLRLKPDLYTFQISLKYKI